MSFNGSGVFNINTAGQPVVSGTVISATAFNALTADLATGLSTCLTKDGQTNPTANLPMANYKFTGMGAGSDATDSANLSQVQSTGVKLIGSVSGADTITGSMTPALTAYAAGQMFYFVAAGDNTGAVTLNINSLGAKNVTKNGTTALVAGEIKSGQTVAVIYDGTRFQIVNPALVSLTGYTGATNTALGVNAGDSLTSGAQNTFVGAEAGTAVTTGANSVFVGYEAGLSTTTGNFTTAVGYGASRANVTGSSNTALGYLAAYNTTASFNTAVGRGALQGASGASGGQNTAVGTYALNVISSGEHNTAVGYQAGDSMTTGYENTILGSTAGQSVTSGYRNTFLGYGSGDVVNSGSFNTFIGRWSGIDISSGSYNTAIGELALGTSFVNCTNSTCLGAGSGVTGSDQVQLGNSSTTTYAYGAVQDRSDARDKADIADTDLGLNFVMALRPRKFRWDMREDYKTVPPVRPSENNFENEADYQSALEQWKVEYQAWGEANQLGNITHDGTHKRNRFHQGLIAQELKQTMDAMGVDFGGYQDHKINGGEDVLTVGYEELIPPLIKAIQELKAEFDAYKATHP